MSKEPEPDGRGTPLMDTVDTSKAKNRRFRWARRGRKTNPGTDKWINVDLVNPLPSILPPWAYGLSFAPPVRVAVKLMSYFELASYFFLCFFLILAASSSSFLFPLLSLWLPNTTWRTSNKIVVVSRAGLHPYSYPLSFHPVGWRSMQICVILITAMAMQPVGVLAGQVPAVAT